MGIQMLLAKQLIDAIPEEGATIIVATNYVGRWLKRGTRERRGFYLSKRCKYLTVYHLKDCDKLLGVRGRILLDYSFVGAAKPEVKARASYLISSSSLVKHSVERRG